MAGLNPVEQEALTALSIILDLMGPGKRKVSGHEHMELMAKVRDAAHKLINKSYGCETGIHTGVCACPRSPIDGR